MGEVAEFLQPLRFCLVKWVAEMCDGGVISAVSNLSRSLCGIKSYWTKHQKEMTFEYLRQHMTEEDDEEQTSGAWGDVGEKCCACLSLCVPPKR